MPATDDSDSRAGELALDQERGADGRTRRSSSTRARSREHAGELCRGCDRRRGGADRGELGPRRGRHQSGGRRVRARRAAARWCRPRRARGPRRVRAAVAELELDQVDQEPRRGELGRRSPSSSSTRSTPASTHDRSGDRRRRGDRGAVGTGPRGALGSTRGPRPSGRVRVTVGPWLACWTVAGCGRTSLALASNRARRAVTRTRALDDAPGGRQPYARVRRGRARWPRNDRRS